jgi:hypothetical protein
MDQGVTEQAERRAAALKKYQDVMARANHPNTPPAEKEVAYRMAGKIMADWEIDELELVAASGATPAIVMRMVRLGEPKGMLLQDELVAMCASIARGFDCKTLIHTYAYPSADRETGDARMPGVYMELVGYSHDVAMVKELYYTTAIDLQMGLMTEKQKDRNYQRQYAQGYAERIVDRIMREIVAARKQRVSEGVSSGTALAIRDQGALVKDFFADLHKGEKFGSYNGRRNDKYDANARARGKDRASQMDLGGAGRIAGQQKQGIGGERRGLNK